MTRAGLHTAGFIRAGGVFPVFSLNQVAHRLKQRAAGGKASKDFNGYKVYGRSKRCSSTAHLSAKQLVSTRLFPRKWLKGQLAQAKCIASAITRWSAICTLSPFCEAAVQPSHVGKSFRSIQRLAKWIKFGMSLTITIASLWWTFRGTHWDEMWASIRYANWYKLFWYLLIVSFIHVARTLRWGHLLAGIEKVPFKVLNEVSAIGFMLLIILPFRLGELARPFLIAQRSTIRRSAAMASVVTERIVDGLVIAIFLRVLLFFIEEDTPAVTQIRIAGNLMFLVFFSGFAFLLFARWQHDRAVAFIQATVGRVAPGVMHKMVNVIDGFISALKQLPKRREIALFGMWTVLYWAANGFGVSLLANAFDCSGSDGSLCQPMHLTLFQGYVSLCVLVVGLMIPAAPGSAGTFQFAIFLALSVFLPSAVLKSSGVAFVNVLWLVQTLQQVVFGIFFMIYSHLSLRDISKQFNK